MLIKVVKNIQDAITSKPHEPLSRRDFLAKTGKIGATYLMLPAFYALLRSDEAKAAAFDSAFRTINPSFAHLECQGGNGMSRMVAPLSSSGSAITSGTTTLGMHSSHTFNSTLIEGVTLNQSDSFYATLLAGGAFSQGTYGSGNAFINTAQITNLFSKVTGTPIHCQSIDDSFENRNNPIQVIAKMRTGQLANLVGTAELSRSPDGARLVPIVRSQSLTGLVDSARLQLTAGGQSGVAALERESVGTAMQTALSSLTTQQNAEHSGKIGGPEILSRIAPGMGRIKNRFDPSVAASLYDINTAANSAALGAWINYANLTDKEKFYLACFDASARQVAGGVYIGESGFDYHDNPIGMGQERHAFIARMVLLWAAVHAARGKPGMLSITTDGGIAYTNAATPNPIGDNGPTSMTLMFYYDPAGRRTLKQLGYFSGETASRVPLVGQDAAYASYAIALTYGLMAGIVVPGTASINEFINEMNRVSPRITGGETQLMQLAGIEI
jgi:hypothetical protein